MPIAKPLLLRSNALTCENGVWMPLVNDDFNYSDGAAEEVALEEILRESSDRRWNAPRFAIVLDDWSLCYHLSPLRANILKGLQLEGHRRVLEIGAGCGALSRYLGDHGFVVDAIEGSPVRAGLTRLRCEDLEQVAVVCANAAELEFPAATYDVVLFIGVLEYAQRYSPTGLCSSEQVKALLRSALGALAPGGIVVIAIENRIGLKYLVGAPEDHLARPWCGIAGYPATPADGVATKNVDGIVTFTPHRWRQLFAELAVPNRFFYPLPDYKLPEAVVSDSGASGAGATALASRVRPVSRITPWKASVPLSLLQGALSEAGLLGECADSLGMVLGHDQSVLDKVACFDWIEFERTVGDTVNPGSCLLSGERQVRRHSNSGPGKPVGSVVQGEPLYHYWLRQAAAATDLTALTRVLAGTYRQLLVQSNGTKGYSTGDSPADMLVDENGCLLLERPSVMESAADNQGRDSTSWYLGALTGFIQTCREDLAVLPVLGKVELGEELAALAFSAAGLNWTPWRQQQGGGTGSSPRTVLARPLRSVAGVASRTTVYWASPGEEFSEDHSVSVALQTANRQAVELQLPTRTRAVSRLRIDPVDERCPDDARFVRIEVFEVLGNAGATAFFTAEQMDAIAPRQLNELEVGRFGERLYFHITGPDPWLILEPASMGIAAFTGPLSIRLILNWADI